MIIRDGADDLTADSPELAEFNVAWSCLFLRTHRELLSCLAYDGAFGAATLWAFRPGLGILQPFPRDIRPGRPSQMTFR